MTEAGRRLVVLATSALLVAAACGSDGGGGGDDEASPTTATGTADEAPAPARGGTLVYGVEADTLAPWMPERMLCAAACYSTVGRTIYEPLTITGSDGESHPYLLESITPSADATSYELVVREGITFHDGTVLDGDAVAFNLSRSQSSPLVGPAVQPIDEITSDGARTVTITLDTSWPAFPYYLTSQLGLMASPTWLQAVDAGSASATEPVGTGPFRYASYEAGENGRFTATRFDGYWRGDGPTSVTGEGLPHLDGIEVRFIPDSDARSRALTAGDVDLIATANGVEISDLAENPDVVVEQLDSTYETETNYLLINHLPEVEGAPNPFADVRVRRALAMATDREALSASRSAGLFPVANGAFPPDRIGHLADTGSPTYDPDGARRLLAEVGGTVAVSLKTTSDPFNLTTSEQLQDMWEDVGFQVTIDQTSQDDFIGEAVAGNFQVFTWRNHAGVVPDTQFVWWSSTTTTGLALNFGRIIDPEVDRLLGVVRATTDAAEERAAAEDLNRRFAEEVHNIWVTWGWWAMAHRPEVHQATRLTIPGAPEGVTALIAGVVTPIETFEVAPA